MINLKCPAQSFLLGVFCTTAIGFVFSEYFSNNKRKSNFSIPKELLDTDLDKEMKIALEIALKAGENIIKGIKSSKEIDSKDTLKIDFVTQTDKDNELLIYNNLSKRFPTYKFIGEETSASNGYIDELTG